MSVEYTSLLKYKARSASYTGGGVGQSKIPQPQIPKMGREAAARTVTLLDVTVRTDTAPRYSFLGYSIFAPVLLKTKGVNYEKTTKDVQGKITQVVFQNSQKNPY